MIILIDYPGFNIRLAKEARKFYTNKIVYYISPQLWAWHKKRVYAIKKYVNKMLVVFPFEKKFYESYGIDAEYVGHPLVKRIDSFLSENSAQSSGSSGKKKVITMLPGSRRDEIKYHLPALIKTGLILKKEFNAEINISIVSGIDGNVFEKYKVSLDGFNLVRDNIYQYIRNSDLVLTKAGTSTIECSLIGTPFLIFYRTSPINYYLLKPIVKVDKLGMVNILADKIIVKEFIQNDFTVSNLVEEARKILNDEIYRNTMCTNLEKIRQMLGSRDASNNAAKIITSLINQN
jgi:lipid-A-disaccharide synthase